MDHRMNRQEPIADLAFIGLGVSNATTLLHLLKHIIRKPPEDPIHITLIEQHEIHYTGVAYGPRSGPNSLIISTLEDFIDDDERRDFIDWLRLNESWLVETFRAQGGELSARWAETFRNADALTRESEICIPRTFFGYFLREQINRVIDTASALGHVKIRSITAEVIDMQRRPGGYALQLTGHSEPAQARKIMLGIGPPAHQRLRRWPEVTQHEHIIDNAYASNIGTLCKQLATELTVDLASQTGPGQSDDAGHAAAPRLNILMTGANASAIETSYLLFDQPALRRMIDRIVVLSPSGRFPERRPLAAASDAIGFRAERLQALRQRQTIRARDIHAAFLADLEHWQALVGGSETPVVSLGAEVVACVKLLSREEKRLFTNRYGVLIGRHQRRSGDEYLDFADWASGRNHLEHVKGRFDEITKQDTTGYTVSYRPEGGSEAEDLPETFHLIINCMGPTSLHEPQSPLITQLLNRGICRVNESGRGFVVDDHYCAAPDLVVTGPLISGNVIANQAVWHVEHCGRLTAIGKVVGQSLHRELVQTALSSEAA